MLKHLSKAECVELIENNYIGHLGFIFGGSPFIVPITYFYDKTVDSIISYSAEGHKIDGMRGNTAVCLQVEQIDSVKKWKCVLIQGKFEELNELDSKYYLSSFSKGIRKIINTKEGKDATFVYDFSNKKYSQNKPIVYRIKIWDITGRYME